MRGKAAGWALFLGCLLLLSFAATTPYSKNADLALIFLRLVIVVVLSFWLCASDGAIRMTSNNTTPTPVQTRATRFCSVSSAGITTSIDIRAKSLRALAPKAARHQHQ